MVPIIFPFVDGDRALKTSVVNLAPDLSDPLLALLGFYKSLGVGKMTVTWQVVEVVTPNQIKSLANMNHHKVKYVGKVMF